MTMRIPHFLHEPPSLSTKTQISGPIGLHYQIRVYVVICVTTMIFGLSDLKIGHGVTRLQDSFLGPDFVFSANDTM